MLDGYKPHETSRVSIGEVFGRLTILETVKKNERAYAVCSCSCGTDRHITRIDTILSGGVESCGCLSVERTVTHGMSRNPLYFTWKNMMRRCRETSGQIWKNYGARGIKVCDRWLDVAKFIEDMEPTFKPGLLLDRIDNDRGYEPGNCRWVMWDVQGSNKRHIKLITHNGKSQTLKDWCKEYEIRYVTAQARIKKQGWDAITAFTTPVDKKNPNCKPYR